MRPTSFEDISKVADTERDAFVAAAVLPHLHPNQALAVLCNDETAYFDLTDQAIVDEFKRRVPCIGGASNLRRVSVTEKNGKKQVVLTPRPHAIKTYRFSVADVRLLKPPTADPPEYQPTDHDQTRLSDFGFMPDAGVDDRKQPDVESWGRRPLFPV